MTLRITTLGKMALFATLGITDTQHNNTAIMLSVVCYRYAECQYAGCCFAECHGTADAAEVLVPVLSECHETQYNDTWQNGFVCDTRHN